MSCPVMIALAVAMVDLPDPASDMPSKGADSERSPSDPAPTSASPPNPTELGRSLRRRLGMACAFVAVASIVAGFLVASMLPST